MNFPKGIDKEIIIIIIIIIKIELNQSLCQFYASVRNVKTGHCGLSSHVWDLMVHQ